MNPAIKLPAMTRQTQSLFVVQADRSTPKHRTGGAAELAQIKTTW
jgi:hypothetical protein